MARVLRVTNTDLELCPTDYKDVRVLVGVSSPRPGSGGCTRQSGALSFVWSVKIVLWKGSLQQGFGEKRNQVETLLNLYLIDNSYFY